MTERPYPIRTRVLVDGVEICAGDVRSLLGAPTVLDGLSIDWGRENGADQPDPSTCSFTVHERLVQPRPEVLQATNLMGHPYWSGAEDPDWLPYLSASGTTESYAKMQTATPQLTQGVAWDGSYYYTVRGTVIYKYDATWKLVLSRSVASDYTANSDHVSAPLAVNGYIYCPIHNDPDPAVIARWNADDLSFVDQRAVTGAPDTASAALAWDADAGEFIMPGYYATELTIQRFDADFAYLGNIPTSITYPQGVLVSGGRYYLMAQDAGLGTPDNTIGRGLISIAKDGTDEKMAVPMPVREVEGCCVGPNGWFTIAYRVTDGTYYVDSYSRTVFSGVSGSYALGPGDQNQDRTSVRITNKGGGPPVVTATNLYPDPGHEYGVGWFSSSNTNRTIDRVTDRPHSGTHSVKMVNLAGGTRFTSMHSQAASDLDLKNGDVITFSGWAYQMAQSATGSQARLRLASNGIDAESVTQTSVYGGWSWLIARATITDATQDLNIEAYTPDAVNGTVYWDDFGFTVNGSAVDWSGDTPASGNVSYRWAGTAGTSASQQLTTVAANTRLGARSIGQLIRLTAGTTFWFGFDLYVDATVRASSLSVIWINDENGNTSAATSQITPTLPPADGWYRMQARAVVNTGQVVTGVAVVVDPPAGQSQPWDAYVQTGRWMVSTASTLPDYFDGNTQDQVDALYRWTGEPEASPSEYVIPARTSTPMMEIIKRDAPIEVWSDVDFPATDTTPAQTESKLVWAGSVSTLTGQMVSDNAIEVTVNGTDISSPLANDTIGDTPWEAETVIARARRVLSLSHVQSPYGTPITIHGPISVGWAIVGYKDVDAQQVMPLLQDMATSAGAVLWVQTNNAGGTELWLEDPSLRANVRQFHIDPTTNRVTIGSATGVDLNTVSAIDLLRDPIQWSQDPTQTINSVDVTWREQTTNPTDGTVEMVDHVVTVTDGNPLFMRKMQVDTDLTSSGDAGTLASKYLAQNGGAADLWTANGFSIDTATLGRDVPDGQSYADRLQVVATLLDGVARYGCGLAIVDLPAWSPGAGADMDYVGAYVEGGTYTWSDGRWQLDLKVTSPQGRGRSATAADFAGTTVVAGDFVGIRGLDCWGVTGPNGTIDGQDATTEPTPA